MNTKDPCKTILSQKGKEILLRDGYTFHKNKNVNNVIYWECRERSHKRTGDGNFVKCAAKAKTTLKDGKHFLESSSVHNHSPDAEDKIYLENNEFLKKESVNTKDKPSQIIQMAKAQISTTALQILPSTQSMKKVINRKRRNGYPKEPANLCDVVIPPNLRSTLSNLKFLQFESNFDIDIDSDSDDFCGFDVALESKLKENHGNILIFSTVENLKLLAKATYFIIDGTFKTAPTIYYQLYSIHAPVGKENSRLLPLVYALMSKKNTDAYLKLFTQLTKIAERNSIILNPEFILSDLN